MMNASTEPDPNLDPILIVDDDPSILTVISQLLEEEGYPVETATNGAEALKRVEQIHPALVLLDMNMPVLNGWDFARQAQERGLDVPIVVMTAGERAHRAAEEIHALGYLAKPFEIEQLLDTVEHLYHA